MRTYKEECMERAYECGLAEGELRKREAIGGIVSRLKREAIELMKHANAAKAEGIPTAPHFAGQSEVVMEMALMVQEEFAQAEGGFTTTEPKGDSHA